LPQQVSTPALFTIESEGPRVADSSDISSESL